MQKVHAAAIFRNPGKFALEIPKSQITTTGWRRPIGFLKLQVIFRKRATYYRALLWKMTNKDEASYGSSPPCKSTVILL